MTTQRDVGVTYSVGTRVPTIMNGVRNGGPFRVTIYRHQNDRIHIAYRAQYLNPLLLLERVCRDSEEIARMVGDSLTVALKRRISTSIQVTCGLISN